MGTDGAPRNLSLYADGRGLFFGPDLDVDPGRTGLAMARMY